LYYFIFYYENVLLGQQELGCSYSYLASSYPSSLHVDHKDLGNNSYKSLLA